MTKTCSTCKTLKKTKEFYKHKNYKDGIRSECIACHRMRMRNHHADGTKTKGYQIRARRGWILRKYGLTIEQFNIMLQSQDFKCAICGCDSPEVKYNQWNIDHDHKTGKVRGLLCFRCNSALGKFKDDIKILEKAIDYLKAAEIH